MARDERGDDARAELRRGRERVDASRVQRGRDVGHRGHERVWYELVLCVSVSANHVSGRGRVARHQRARHVDDQLRRGLLRRAVALLQR